MFDAVNADALNDGGFGCVLGGQDQIFDALLAGADSDGECAADGPDGAIEGKFTHGKVLVQAFANSHGSENGECHGEVKT